MVRLFLRVEREEYTDVPVDVAHHQEGFQHGEAVLEGGEGGVQQLYLLIQLTTRRESSMVRLFLRFGEGGVQQLYLLIQLTTRRESSMVRLFLRVEREEYTDVPVDAAHHQEGVYHGEAVLEGGEGGVQQL